VTLPADAVHAQELMRLWGHKQLPSTSRASFLMMWTRELARYLERTDPRWS
jgi:hypothetical protein